MKRLHFSGLCFLIGFYCILPIWGLSQDLITISGKSIPELKSHASKAISLYSTFPSLSLSPSPVSPKIDKGISSFFELDYCPPRDEAFFCRLELKLEKKLRFPFKFRLGDVEYVDYLEGKRSY